LAPFETGGGGNAAKAQDLWIGDTIRFPSPAPVILFSSNDLAICRGGKGGNKKIESLKGGADGSREQEFNVDAEALCRLSRPH
jgi:hypothetical protein